MHYKQFGILLAVLIALAVVFGVWATRSPEAAPVVEQHILNGTSTTSGDYQYVENEQYYTVKVLYPASAGLKAQADAKARLTIEQALADRVAEFKKNGGLENITPEDAAIQNLGADRKYALDLEYKKYSSPDTVSYLYTVYEDTGGAHPNTYYMSFVFDQNGDKVALSELFPNNPNWLQELSLLVSNDVVAQYKARTQVADTTGLLFEEGLAPKIENFSNFVVDTDKLVVFIPPYQVAAYAVGSFEVRIPLKDLQ